MDSCKISYKSYINSFAKEIENSSVLDVGCGRGDYTEIFCHSGNRVIGLDVADWRNKNSDSNFNFIIYKGDVLPFGDKEFDVVVSFDVIEHIDDDFSFVREVRRVLKDEGKILIATPNRTRLSNMLYKLVGKPIKYPYTLSESGNLGKLVHIREYTNKELVNLFRMAGFKDIKVDNFWFGLRGFINIGINNPPIKSLSQYLFLRND